MGHQCDQGSAHLATEQPRRSLEVSREQHGVHCTGAAKWSRVLLLPHPAPVQMRSAAAAARLSSQYRAVDGSLLGRLVMRRREDESRVPIPALDELVARHATIDERQGLEEVQGLKGKRARGGGGEKHESGAVRWGT